MTEVEPRQKDALPGRKSSGQRTVGISVRRLEDDRMLRGQGQFIADIVVPGALHAAFVRSSEAHAMVSGIDTAVARSMPGVHAVLVAGDLPHQPLVDAVEMEGLAKTPQSALAIDRVRFVGEAIAVVLAEDRYLAEDAADYVSVDYTPLPVHTEIEAAAPSSDLIHPDLGTNVLYHQKRSFGDVAAAFERAHLVVKGEFHSARSSASPLEGRGVIAQPAAGRLTVWSSTQAPHHLRRRLALCLGMGESRIRVIAADVGGAFGQKIPAQPEEVAVALAALKLGVAVRWAEDRRENLTAGNHAKQQSISAELAVAEDGTFLGIKAEFHGDAGAYSFNNSTALVEPYFGAMLMTGPYTIRDYECTIRSVLTNKSPVAPYRGVGWTASHTARELLIDRAARRLGRDPGDLRRQNLVPSDAFPYRSCTGMVFDSGSYVESMEAAMESIGYQDIRRRQDAQTGTKRIGVGVSPYVEPGGWGSVGSREIGWSFASHDTVRVAIEPDGEVSLAVGLPTQGQGSETTLRQVVGEHLGVDLSRIAVHTRDTDGVPVSTSGTRASRTAVVAGGALALAAEDLNDKLRKIAAAMFECSVADVERSGDLFAVQGAPSTTISYQDVVQAAYFNQSLRQAGLDVDLSASRFYDPGATYSNGCVTAAVEVDTETGAVEVIGLAAVEDCGTVINPMIVEGQVRGAVAQGVGAALLEGFVYDAAGQPLTSSLMDYLLPTASDVPSIQVGHKCSPSPNTVGGVKGMGESGLIATPAAVANAVADALGSAAVTSLPLRPEDVLALADEWASNRNEES